MASSSSSSTASSGGSPRTAPSSSPDFSGLPIMALREKIVEKILENRVTLIVGETGCGKSSQVPQFLLDENIKPILCTQPRRFAVVAVAKMVAKARNCDLGAEVGYHIGHGKHFSSSSKIIFKTAGVLLEEMCERGLNALDYEAIVLDEVHERSVESDLVLVCVKQFLLKNKKIRLVLMSATADIARYREYFGDIGRDERVEVLAIPSSNQPTIFQRRVLYLEQVTELLGRNSGSLNEEYCSGEEPITSDPNFRTQVHSLIHDLVLWIHEHEPDVEKSILVFLPTYRSLEHQWVLLQPMSSLFNVHILHSSIDTEQALEAMKISKSRRKIILATNIAESSVTIPKVAFVIDSCRSLQVYWDSNRKADASELVWISKSQAEQRRGRTGRTCDGEIYRLVTGSFFSKFKDYESPTILRLSLRQQVLLMCCAESRAINDPKVLLQKALDPPEPDIVEDAIDLLIHMGALEKTSHRGRYEPTFYGRLLASFSLSFDASVLILKFGVAGMLLEGILLGILMDTQPLPILHPFGEEDLFMQYMQCYFSSDSVCNKDIGQKEMILLGNLCAYKFWQRVFKDEHRIRNLKEVLQYEGTGVPKELLLKIEEDWCFQHNLVQSSLNRVSDIYEDVIGSLHRFRPGFLSAAVGFPSYYYPYKFQHTCLLEDEVDDDDEQLHESSDGKKCVAGPYLSHDHFQTESITEKMATVIKEVRALYAGAAAPGAMVTGMNGTSVHGQASVCVYFLKGTCSRGSRCTYSHSLQAQQPACKFFLSLKGCRNGDSCHFSHNTPELRSYIRPNLCFPEDNTAYPTALLEQFPPPGEGDILILDDTNLHLTSNIAGFCGPQQILASTSLSETSLSNPSLDNVRILWGQHHPYETIISEPPENLFTWNDIKCVMWFPSLDSVDMNLEKQANYLQGFFEYMAVRVLANCLYNVRVVLTMNNIRFSQLQVEKLGRNSFFFLNRSFPFDEGSFGEVLDGTTTRKPMVPSKPVSYVFFLYLPSEFQLGGYRPETANLCEMLDSVRL